MRSFITTVGLVVALTGVLAACTSAPPASITVYVGRSEALVGPLIERFKSQTGIQADVRYGSTSELAALILEEGTNTPADVYLAQDAGALGAIAAAGHLRTLPSELLSRVPERFRSPDGHWVGLSGRARVLVYDSRELTAEQLPASIEAFTDPAWSGRLGWAPTNGSFQAFVTAFRLLKGDAAAQAWLEGIQANDPVRYDENGLIVQAVADGEIDVGFVNHYYLLQAMAEQGADFPVRNHFFGAADPGALVNVAGAGILTPTDAEASARRFIEFLLSNESQAYFATETFEYPLVSGVAGPEGLPALDQIQSPDLDLSDLSDLQATLTMLNEAGVLP